LVNGKEDFEALGNMMELLAVKIEKKKQKQGRSTKAQKAFKEWKTDYIRANDEEMMIMMAEQLTKLRQDDKLGFKKNVKTVKETPYVGLRPTSSGNCGSLLVRNRLMRKGPHMMRISNSIKNKAIK
jgi:hypothetical protein